MSELVDRTWDEAHSAIGKGHFILSRNYRILLDKAGRILNFDTELLGRITISKSMFSGTLCWLTRRRTRPTTR